MTTPRLAGSAVSVALLTALFAGCGGKALDAGDDRSSGGSSSGGSLGTGGNSASGGASSGTGGAGSVPERCRLPLDSGICDGYSEVYGYDAAQNRCVPFVYGLCGGNDNRFDTLEQCEGACQGPTAVDACNTSSDCVLRTVSCCGACEASQLTDFEAINIDNTDRECGNVLCEPCPAPPPGTPSNAGYFAAVCEAGRCVAHDLRTCQSDTDCVLRLGLDCCDCGSAGPWVAVNASADFSSRCEGTAGCDGCLPLPPEGSAALCLDGQCSVVANLK